MSNKSEVLRPRRLRSLSAALFLGCAAAFLSGCAHPGPGCGVIQQSISIPLPFEAVWPAVVQEAAGLSTNSIADRLTGSVQTDEVALHESWFPINDYACKPAGAFEDWSSARLTTSFTVLPKSGNETQVTISCRFYRFCTSSSDVWRRWPSNGRFEQQVLSNIAARATQ